MPEVFIVSYRVHQLYKEYRDVYPSRRAAFRAAKRDAGIPMGRQPRSVVRPRTTAGGLHGLDDRNVRLYIFPIFIGAIAFEFHIREDRADEKLEQPPHFNAGQPPKKLKKHYFWR